MTAAFARLSLLAAALAPAVHGQFELRAVVGAAEQPVSLAHDIGWIYPGETLSAVFRIRNVSQTTAVLDYLTAPGTGFTLAAPPLPVSLAPQGSVDFTVRFQAELAGTYSAALTSNGISTLLTATVRSGLTYKVETADGFEIVPAQVEFGRVELGNSQARRFAMENRTLVTHAAPAPAVQGAGFALHGTSPAQSLAPGESAYFEVEFAPEGAIGPRTGVLTLGDRAYALAGTALDPPPPAPRLAVTLARPESAQQGSIAVTFDSPARASGTGTVAIALESSVMGPVDPTVKFAAGGTTVSFTYEAGDAQARFDGQAAAPFQTGSTAGALVFTARLGESIDVESVSIAPAPVSLSSVRGMRGAGEIEIAIAGYDNTRTAGMLSFTFYDKEGKAIAAAIQSNATAAFAGHFQNSTVGGAFSLKAVFPVSGDVTAIAAFEAQIANAAGTAATARVTL